jgi:hypothetical protein
VEKTHSRDELRIQAVDLDGRKLAFDDEVEKLAVGAVLGDEVAVRQAREHSSKQKREMSKGTYR